MAYLNGQYIHVISEDPSYEVDITDQPVEKGINLTDHVQIKPRTLSLSGFIVSSSAAEIRAKLISDMDRGTLMSYVGRNAFTGLIKSFSSKHDHRVANGFSFTMTIKTVRIASASFEGALPSPISTQTKKIDNSGMKLVREVYFNLKNTKFASKERELHRKAVFEARNPWAKG